MNREKGMILVTTAVAMVAIIAVLGLAVDMGMIYTARTSAQHAADAGALAGAYTFQAYPSANINNPAYGSGLALATTVAKNTVTQNKIVGNPILASDVIVTFPASNRLTVAVQKAIPTYFIKVVGLRQVTVRAQATAEAATDPSGTTCMRPFWITLSTLRGGSCSNPTPPVGSTITLWDKFVSSQWGLVGLSASTINNQIQSCSGQLNSCSDTMLAKTGASVGGVRPAMENLICPYEGGACLPCSSDPKFDCGDWSWQGPNEYLNDNTLVTGSSSPALMTIAIWDDCSGPGPSPGRTSFPIAGYAQLFVTDVGSPSTKQIDAKFVEMSSCPASSSGPSATGPGAIPIRLINP